jgi:uncharacterized glyoxalase superfamily protein PhnB
MKLLNVTPMLTVTSIDDAVRFYRDILEFKCLGRMNQWACLGKDGVDVMFALPNAHLPFEKSLLTGSLYLYTDDVDQWWEKLKDRCVVEYPIENFSYGMREFAIRDNSGYLLQFGQEIK